MPSMSQIGNAPIESFCGHSETESYDLKTFKTYEELVTDVKHYIYFYNIQRYQAKLNNLTPLEFRNQIAQLFLLSNCPFDRELFM